MDLLAVLFPQVRAAVLRLLFADATVELHLRELTRRSGLALGTLQTELAKLTAAQLVVSERDGNRRYYRANAAHPLFPVLRQLVLQATPGATAQPGAAPTGSRSATVSPPVVRPPTAVSHTLTLNEID